MIHEAERKNHALTCIAAFAGWYGISFLIAFLPGYTALLRSEIAIPVLQLVFWLPFTLIIWRHYQKRYCAMPLGHITPSGLLLPVAALFMLMIIHAWFGRAEPWTDQLQHNSTLHLPIMVVSLCLAAPVIEELIFRGFLLNAGLGYGKRGELVATVMTSLLFAIIHTQYQNPTTFIWLFVFSAILCQARLRTDSLLIPIILHGMNNALVLILLVI